MPPIPARTLRCLWNCHRAALLLLRRVRLRPLPMRSGASEVDALSLFSLFLLALTISAQVWFAHKLICGKYVKPFRLPSLTPFELAEAKKNLTKPLGVDEIGPYSLLDNLGVDSSIGLKRGLVSFTPSPPLSLDSKLI